MTYSEQEMTMEQGNGAVPQPVRHVHVERCISRSLTDGQAVFQFEAVDGGMFFLRVDVAGLVSLRTAAQEVQNEHAHQSNSYAFNVPQTFGVQSDSNRRGFVVLGMNPTTPQETVFLISDVMALELSKQLRDEALSHMTPEQRAREMGKLKVESAFGRIILPGGQ